MVMTKWSIEKLGVLAKPLQKTNKTNEKALNLVLRTHQGISHGSKAVKTNRDNGYKSY